MNAIHADPVSTAIETDESSPSSKSTPPRDSSDNLTAISEERVRAIDAMAACMLESTFGG